VDEIVVWKKVGRRRGRRSRSLSPPGAPERGASFSETGIDSVELRVFEDGAPYAV
jgi:hypothetical protein